jgi:hypothetical protein
MTKEQAIKLLSKDTSISEIHRLKDKGLSHTEVTEAIQEAMDMGIEALEKQIAKKPQIYTDTITTVYEDYQIDVYECGNCGSYLDDVDGKREYAGEYCECCGQKIDWSEVE